MITADIAKFLFFTSVIVWLLPPFKQFKGKYFLFFLILACFDPISLLFMYIFKSSLPSQATILINFCLLLSLIDFRFLQKRWIWIIPITLILFSPSIFRFNGNQIIIVYLLLQTGITLIILKNLITGFVSSGKLSLFHIVFLFYQFTAVAKFSNLLIGF
ncbi:MAG: hypothetical protein WC061_00910, partial [Melioribacteraceae bacterium]